jgi:hypothetical protein
MLRLVFAGAITLGGVYVTAGSASAQPLCESATVDGSIFSRGTTAGPACVPYPDAAECNVTTAGLGSTVFVVTNTCVPAP